MTNDTLPQLLAAIQTSDDGDFLRVLAETTLNRLMDFDADNAAGATRHERSPERTTYRNGYRERVLETRVGALDLKIPKFRSGPAYYPGFILEPRRLMEKALTAVIQEAWINGVSTRRVEELVQAMGMSGISKSQVSKLCKEIDERVGSFLERPLEGEWPYLWLDATYLKQRQGGRIVSVAAIIAVAATTDGRREIIGLSIGDSEAMVFWMEFLRSLVKRGLKGVKLVISDAHEGLKASIVKALGRHAPSALYPMLRYVNQTLLAWAMRKFKRFARHKIRASHFLQRLSQTNADLFEHWRIGMIGTFA
jgi:putative transposase